MYDALGQSLTALKLDIQWVSGRLSDADESLRVRAREMETLVSSTIDGVRHLARELRPATLDTLGLIAATRSQVRDVEQRTGIRCNLTVPATEPEWSEDRRTTVFRILQEALTNVVRHAQAKQVAVALWERDNEIVLEVVMTGGESPQPRRQRPMRWESSACASVPGCTEAASGSPDSREAARR